MWMTMTLNTQEMDHAMQNLAWVISEKNKEHEEEHECRRCRCFDSQTPTAGERSCHGKRTQHLRSLNSRLVSETVKLRKQLIMLVTANIASTDVTATAASTAVRPVKGIRRNRAARHAATIAAVKTVNPAAPIAPTTSTVDPIQQDTVVGSNSSNLISSKTLVSCRRGEAPPGTEQADYEC